MIDLGLLKTAPEGGDDLVRDADSTTFERDVLQASMKTPVIVDFWAPWCGPCKQLMPVLEKQVRAAGGAVRMVKVDIDRNPDLAQVFRVQSVPTVYAFYQGQPVDGFMGAKPESEIKAMIDKLVQQAGGQDNKSDAAADITQLLAQADGFFAEGNYLDAIAIYSTALDADPDSMAAMGGIGWSLAAQGEMEGVADILSQLTDEQKKHDRIRGLVFLQEQAATGPYDETALQKAADGGDLSAFYDLARAHLAKGDTAAAIEALVELTRKDREWQDQKARQLLLQLFDAMGPQHPHTAAGRRKLSAVLFS